MAAFVSAGIGVFLLGLLFLLAELSEGIKDCLAFYPRVHTLSGISTLAVIGWLFSWAVLFFTWRNREVRFKGVFTAAMLLIGLGLLFMFPPLIRVFKH